ncbi:4-oxalomesaconate tautomerase [Phreatobacter oligotrophus]|uniref:4-oxalomesaconate tautomerase n=1 Tax=Phreatobacter oligotrophus TaxID=1122261 RepID=A0A2T4ZHC3_9HYPH|nr:4-oxalomesaconate tautomerase [Phreatobacter oligotrophus]PTM61388.1 4-oxalomesaconate tautomerase [Phreatobacter oligotrophus]
MATGIRCMLMRGGTSKGAYFLKDDLPSDPAARDAVLLSVMGSPDPRQIDGVGGAHPLTSKVAIVSRSEEPGVDIDFLFAQVLVDRPRVDYNQNCGNILAGIGPFAIERGLIAAADPVTTVTVRTVNTGTVAEMRVATPGGRVTYAGDAAIDGVPGTASPIPIDFLDAEGSVCGALLPTGRAVDVVEGVEVTLIDNGMPVIVLAAESVGVTGAEPHAVLNADAALKARLEAIRLAAAPLMNIADAGSKNIPKLALVSPPREGGAINTRSFIPHECHAAIGVFAAVSVATACVLPGSPAHRLAKVPPGREKLMSCEHPTGEFTVRLTVGGTEEAPVVERAGLLRTARALFDGVVFPRG